MFLQDLKITNFRNKNRFQTTFESINIILADNMEGKTNTLEAIFYLATGKSFRAEEEIEVIKEDELFTNIEGRVLSFDDILKLRVFISKEEGKKKKSLQVNSINRSFAHFIGLFKAIIFTPEDFDIIHGSPEIRRKYLDTIICQINPNYTKSLSSYKKVVTQRNRLLSKIQEGKSRRNELEFWNYKLIELGRLIQEQRYQLIDFLTNTIKKYISLYKIKRDLKLEYHCSLINQDRLIQYEQKEYDAGITLIGPHRDDFEILVNKKDIQYFGSRGEQRIGILALTMAALDYIEYFMKERPVLLLDDIFSELDLYHRQSVLSILGRQQTIITTTEWEFNDSIVQIIQL